MKENLSNLDPKAKRLYKKATEFIDNLDNSEGAKETKPSKESHFDEMDKSDLKLLGTYTDFEVSTP